LPIVSRYCIEVAIDPAARGGLLITRLLTIGLLLEVLLAACGGGETAEEASPLAPAAGEGEVLVFAAASLTDAFNELGMMFTEENRDATVTFNFASSSQLATQITEGAPADVFASANQTQMDVVGDADLLEGESQQFTSNLLAIAVEPGNPLGVTGLADLANPELTLILATEEVPAGQYAREALDAAGVTAEPASLEVDVRAVLSRVTLGEADAGIVYASDITAAGADVEGVEIPEEENVVASYPIAALTDAPNPDGAAAFIEFVLSDDGLAVLGKYGFTEPE